MQTLTIRRPDDWHIHLRDEPYLARTVTDAARVFGRAIVMPNLDPPVTQVQDAVAYRNRIMAYAPEGFDPLMTLYLTDATTQATVIEAAQSNIVHAFKLYPAGATTNSAFGVKEIENLFPIFETMEKHGVVLCIHGEVTDADIDIFDREAVFIDTILTRITQRFPKLKVVLEHITTQDAVDFVAAGNQNIAATITIHHLLYNRNDMLVGGMKPIHYCLPVLKRNRHQQSLIKAATSGDTHFFLGTDSAPHSRRAKENACGCAAGCYTAHCAIELYAEVFANEGQLSQLEGFASLHGANFYDLPPHDETIRLVAEDWVVPETFEFGQDTLIPTRGGEIVKWRVVEGSKTSAISGTAT